MSKHMHTGAALLTLTLALHGCSFVQENVADMGPTLADLEPATLPNTASSVPPVSLDELEASYRAALAVTQDPQVQQQIRVRLADIEMARSENNQVAGTPAPQHFDAAIEQYNALLAADIALDEVQDERLLYRLSKAYAMDGRMAEANAALTRLVDKYPQSEYATEAYFRMGEYAFSNGDYNQSQALYQLVIESGKSTPYYTNAVYMLGWSQFKDNRFRASIGPFTEVLDTVMPEDENLGELNQSNRGLVNDTLRVMGITFSYLNGAESITEIYNELGPRHYQHMLYEELGEFYLQKERYADAADTYENFVEAFPNDPLAPQFALERMAVQKTGGMGDELLASKERFVDEFGSESAYWAGLTPEQREQRIKPTLLVFLDELSSFYHAKAQALSAAQQDYNDQVKAGKKPKNKPEPARPAYLKAADYYEQYLAVFPAQPSVPEKTFLLAESYEAAGELAQAEVVYRRLAFEQVDPTYGADAGYSVILILQQLARDGASELARQQWQEQAVTTAITFADTYPSDLRAAPVVAQAADYLFQQGDTERAVALAERVTQWQPPANPGLQINAWLIIAHTRFDATDYTGAEAAYREVLALMDAEDPDRPDVVERIAASMFQGAEQKVAAGDVSGGIDQLLAIEQTAPGSDIAIKGQYEAGNYMMEQERYLDAEALFSRFQGRYPDHDLSDTLTPKFAVIYQETAQWGKAAGALTAMAASTLDPEQKRQTEYMAAELYQKSGRREDAMKAYERYIKKYPEPFDLATEARFQLLTMAKESGSLKTTNYWREQLIRADKEAGNNSTDRAHYLAASAANDLALQEFNRFESIKLTLPIKKSLAQKKNALERTLSAYKEVIDYGVGEYVTEANYRIGNVYSQLSRDLLNSERPKGLDPLAMEQYEILLEEQAYPFEEKSIDLLAANAERAWDGFYDEWVKRSLNELAKLLPARYGKEESTTEVSHGIY